MSGRLRGGPLPYGHGSVTFLSVFRVVAEPDQGVRRGRGRPPHGQP
jgi:hypothetical protein